MRVEYLTNDRINDFINYCKSVRTSNEDFLQDDELKKFKLGEENPTYILMNYDNEMIGAVSLMIDRYHKRGKMGRFRLLHVEKHVKDGYELLLRSIIKHTHRINKIVYFVKEDDYNKRDILKELDFIVEGYSYDMIRENCDTDEFTFGEGFRLKSFEKGKDENDWCEIRNIGFAESEPPRTPDTVKDYWEDDGHLDGGMLLLYDQDEPIGTVRASREWEAGTCYAFISVLCVKPEYRHKGLGKNLLRAAIKFGKKNGLTKAMLCVDLDNEKALNLYLDEGFKKFNSIVCYQYVLN